jgi:large conductance mechanosensitive channel
MAGVGPSVVFDPIQIICEGTHMAIRGKLESFDPTKKVGGLLDEFKAFAFKGSVIDLAVGVIIGAAFGAIIKSLVDYIIMPVVSMVIPSEKGFESWEWRGILFGKFLADVVNFLIVAFVLFIFIKKFLGWVMRAKQQEAVAAAPPMTKDQELLTEIRDLMQKKA